jgi:hypothetical protein
MPRNKHAPGRKGPERWIITVCDAGNTREIFHAAAGKREIEALAAEARRHNADYRIWINPPTGKVYHWD